MNKKNLEILGLEEGATFDEIKAAYESLRERYLEERFQDGEVGNNAARMLTRIENAYNELCSEMSENTTMGSGGGDLYGRVEACLKDGNLQEAQRLLDSFNERGAQWHYYQSVVFYRKNWINESKKQLEIAIQLDPTNEKYKETYRKLNEKINYDANNTQGAQYQNGGSQNYQGAYQGQNMYSQPMDDQMGGDFCANCVECCACNLLLNCLCNGCCR